MRQYAAQCPSVIAPYAGQFRGGRSKMTSALADTSINVYEEQDNTAPQSKARPVNKNSHTFQY